MLYIYAIQHIFPDRLDCGFVLIDLIVYNYEKTHKQTISIGDRLLDINIDSMFIQLAERWACVEL